MEHVASGNIIGLVGLKAATAGETISTIEVDPFEAIEHIFEPVITKSVEAKNTKDLPKLIEALRKIAKEIGDVRTGYWIRNS